MDPSRMTKGEHDERSSSSQIVDVRRFISAVTSPNEKIFFFKAN